MELLSSKIFVSSAQIKLPATYWSKGNRFQYVPLTIRSKKVTYQDFQEYAKPSRLLQATEVRVCTDVSVEKAVESFTSGRSKALYSIKLQTSKTFGSGLTDVNSGVLLCLIDENGFSILQRLPTISPKVDTSSEDKAMYDGLHFQRGSDDEFIFDGPNLGRIMAVWIGLESGQWRIAALGLTVIHDSPPSSSEANWVTKQLTGFQYSFEFDDTLLGESNDFSIMEFRPHVITAFSGDESALFDKKLLDVSRTLGTNFIVSEESMKEYTDLKFSLLFYDAILVLAGAPIASFSTGEKAMYAFLIGGLFGLSYLLLLQRSVDGLEAPELMPVEGKESSGQFFGRLRGPISCLVLAFALAIVTAKYASGKDAARLTANDLIFGTMGFIMCKVSVVLAAFKPLPFSFRDSNQKV